VPRGAPSRAGTLGTLSGAAGSLTVAVVEPTHLSEEAAWPCRWYVVSRVVPLTRGSTLELPGVLNASVKGAGVTPVEERDLTVTPWRLRRSRGWGPLALLSWLAEESERNDSGRDLRHHHDP
jgi:hypothetical protein